MSRRVAKSSSPTRSVTLSWCGKEDAAPAPTPSDRCAVYATADGRGRFFHGDNLAALSRLADEERGTVTLAYMDPPFFTNRVHETLVRYPGPRKAGRPEPQRPVAAFDDRWADQAAYLEALYPRLVALRALLAPHGSLVVHVDPRTSHYVKVLADEVFGADAFASEIVWRYRRWPSKTPNFQRVHDVLLRYRKDPKAPPRWNALYEPLAPSTLATWGTKRQRAVLAADGARRARSSTTEADTPGAPLGDVWDIGVLAPLSRERTGYPSQKPEALLERLVLALTEEGDVVLDPYAGSGTTCAVAARLGRRYVGVDSSKVAVKVAMERLERGGSVLRLVA